MKKLAFILLSVLFLYGCAANGKLEGYVKDSLTGDGIGSAQVQAYQAGTMKGSVSSLDDEALPIHGYYDISIPLGNYEIRILHDNYQESTGNYVTLTSSDNTVSKDWILSGEACRDNDRDGFGLPAGASCPKGEVADCNDSNANMYPGGPEIRVMGTQETFRSIDLLQNVFDTAETGNTVQSKAVTYAGDITIDQDKALSVAGGYDCSFSNVSGSTAVNGDVTITKGILTIHSGVLTIGP